MVDVTLPATPCCGNCAAWHQTNGMQGECRLLPPQAVFMGFQQPKLAGQPPAPMIAGVFPAVHAPSLCRQWNPMEGEPTAEGMAAEQGLVAHAGQDPVKRTSAVAKIIERAKAAGDTPQTVSTGREHLHTPVKRNGEWVCSHCGAHEDTFGVAECKGNPADGKTT